MRSSLALPAAFGTTLTPGDTVVLARDTRPSGGDFAEAAAVALRQTGCRVVDVGMCSTPGAKLMIAALDAEGAIIITASHNPAPWNGLKLVRADGIFLNAEEGARVEDLFQAGEFRSAASGELEIIDSNAVVARHVQQIVDYVNADAIRRAGFKVAVDPCNGTGGLVVPSLLDVLGVEAALINARPDGDFAHDPEPVPANLVQLGQAVRDGGCAIGFAIDPDADRVALVDSSGTPVGEDYTLALAVQAVAARQSGPVVTTLSTSQAVTDVAVAHNCPVFLTAVGEVHVVEKMMSEEAVIGGEGNGGVIVTQLGPSRDAALGLALVLEAMACTGRSLEDLIAALPSYAIDKRKITCTPEQLADGHCRAARTLSRGVCSPGTRWFQALPEWSARMPLDSPPCLQHRTYRPGHCRERECLQKPLCFATRWKDCLDRGRGDFKFFESATAAVSRLFALGGQRRGKPV